MNFLNKHFILIHKYKIIFILLLIFSVVYTTENIRLRDICNKNIITDAELSEAIKLLNRGADPNQVYMLNDPLLVRLMNGYRIYNDKNHEKLFIALLDHGADPNKKNIWGEINPLLSYGFNIELERELIKHGAKVNDRMLDGSSVFQAIINRGNKEEIDLFQESLNKEKLKRVGP